MGEEAKSVYRLQGLSCANCARKFENNVKNLEGVVDAQVNIGAAKITVYGEAAIEQIEDAGAFDEIKVFPNEQRVFEKESFWKKKSTMRVGISLILLIVAFALGEESPLSVGLYMASIVVGGYTLFIKGFRNLIKFEFDMNTLMTIAIIGAAIIGEWSEGAMVVILFAISEVLEKYSMDKARDSIRSLMEIAPKEALIRRGDNELHVGVEDILIDDIMIIKPGEKLAMDGVVVKGVSNVSEAAITGESIPVTKEIASEVYAGSLNEEGYLEVRVTKKVQDTALAKIIHLVEEAQGERAPSQAFVDTFAKYYTPAIMIFAVLVAIIPPLAMGADWSKWIYEGLAVLVVGCPCALVISTPIAIVTAIGNGAKNGVLIKGGIHLENAGKLTSIAFDKTGTLTKGKPEVTDVIVCKEVSHSVLAIAAALEKNSQHPLASAIVKKAQAEQVNYTSLEVNDFTSITGKGVEATIDGIVYVIGSPSFVGEMSEEITTLQGEGKTVVALASNNEIIALFAIRDEVRESSKGVISKLYDLGIKETVMLTGDNKLAANAIGKQLGVTAVHAELLPEDKLAYIKERIAAGEKIGMIGDGINDAPALAASTTGIAMGGAGTDTALETADLALMGDDLQKLPYTIILSRKTMRIIKQNITFSLVVKLVALLLVIPGWLTLWIAIFADMGATLLVTLNSLRLLKVKE